MKPTTKAQLCSKDATGKVYKGDIVPIACAERWVEDCKNNNHNVYFWYEIINGDKK